MSKTKSNGKQQRCMFSRHKFYLVIVQIRERLLVVLFISYGDQFWEETKPVFACIESVSYVRHSSTNRFRVQKTRIPHFKHAKIMHYPKG